MKGSALTSLSDEALEAESSLALQARDGNRLLVVEKERARRRRVSGNKHTHAKHNHEPASSAPEKGLVVVDLATNWYKSEASKMMRIYMFVLGLLCFLAAMAVFQEAEPHGRAERKIFFYGFFLLIIGGFSFVWGATVGRWPRILRIFVGD